MKFILTVPDNEGVTICEECPFKENENVCQYCCENDICIKCNFAKAQIEEYDENRI